MTNGLNLKRKRLLGWKPILMIFGIFQTSPPRAKLGDRAFLNVLQIFRSVSDSCFVCGATAHLNPTRLYFGPTNNNVRNWFGLNPSSARAVSKAPPNPKKAAMVADVLVTPPATANPAAALLRAMASDKALI